MSKKRIYTVATSHLDTVWSWDFETTVSKYIYDTLVDNIALFKKYPTYVFSFEGSYRYELMEEYYPELFKEMSEYIKEGRWNVTGSAYENGDVNCPSPEALFRNILIGNSYFDEKFGKRSLDIYLPDCFGFGWALPSIAHHANLKGFTTQKLAWGSAYGVPFDIGKWYGVDGNFIYASTNPHDYYFTFTKLRNWDFVQNKLKENEKYGLDWTYMFHGIGDRGGAPQEATVKYVDDEMKKNDTDDIEILATSADQIYRDIDKELPQEVKDQLPTWNTELVMQNHGVGGYTSRAIGKRWNAKCQDLADMAERSSVMADYVGEFEYNEPVLEKAWKRPIAHQFHDDTPGTSCQRVYRRSWNDYALSINQFEGEIDGALSAFSNIVDSSFCKGTPIMVYNSIESDRQDVVAFDLSDHKMPFIKVYDCNNNEVPSQIIYDKFGIKKIIFLANVKSVGTSVYDIRQEKAICQMKTDLVATSNSLSNSKYDVKFNANGNISSIVDKTDDNRELLSAPIALGLFNYTGSDEWPAWEMNFKEANKEPDRIPKLVSMELVEEGPVRITMKVVQKDDRSVFNTFVSLTTNGDVVEVRNEYEWQSLRTMCKNVFSLSATNEKATFDLGLGAIERTNMSEKLFEVPAQKWSDITDKSGDFGVSVISSCKHGWDKFNDNTLRLTAIHTPKKNYRIDSMQSMMDLGLNLFEYAVFSHKGTVGADTQMAARRFTTPLVATQFKKQEGTIKGDYSFASVNNNDVIIRAIKKAHHKNDGEIIVRLNEGSNKEIKNFELAMGNGIESARELWASEEYKGEATIKDGKLVTDFKPYEIKTFGFKLKDNKDSVSYSIPVELENTSFFDLIHNTYIPKSLYKTEIVSRGIKFTPSPNGYTYADGQVFKAEKGEKIAVLCAAANEVDVTYRFKVRGLDRSKIINSISQAYARWDLYDFKETAYIKKGNLGYEFTHCEDKKGNPYYAKQLYFWVKIFNGTVEMPKDKSLIILAVTRFKKDGRAITPLIDKIQNNRPFDFDMTLKEKWWHLSSKFVWNLNDKDNYLSHWNNGLHGLRKEQTGKRVVTRTVDTVGH